MINFVKHDNIDREKWDLCISNAHNGLIYGYSWYLDIVSEHWDALINDDYSQVFPVIYNKKAGINYVYPPPFTQQSGLFSIDPVSSDDVTGFVKAIPSFIKYGEINLNVYNPFISKDFIQQQNRTYHLSVEKGISEIRNTYSQNIIRNINKAEKNKIKIKDGVAPECIIELFVKNKGSNIPGLKNKHYKILKKLIHTCIDKNHAQIWGAFTQDNKLCAGAFFLHNKQNSIFLFSGSNNEARQKGAMSYLIDQYVESLDNRFKILDFEGSNDENLARFYRSFGSVEKHYTRIYINRLPVIKKSFLNIYKKYKGTI